ncbi:glucan endo-1,3-beta-D-glucosidase isoform X2 [Nicotiana sylvestris]|uniref:glucan endo-1,3-beta-D-glucosidase n=2 Tax=Nicotiana TaxID=4085 RepID=A0A1S4A393_TOBAC|nr:PREDICTED: glucan endo-1,3-beta-D-glucosidase isoform X2 [Nicotiana sylvestris]XP_016471080.1 PREDICTED: glucan endo-1,3-beta-D-glucosidase-like isoform X2 [Nicotiana tabacum]
MATQKLSSFFLIFLVLLQSLSSAESQAFIGVNYGQLADNLPPVTETVKLIQSTRIEKVRLYGADPAIIKALANTGIGIVIGAANGDIPALASDPNYAGQWVNSNVLAYYPASKIIVVTVGNEVVTSGDQNLIPQLLPAMQNVQNALNAASLGGKIKVSTVHAMSILSQSDPPSSGLFSPVFGDTLKALLQFHKENGSPLMINPYPFFAYQSDPRPETLAFCLFQPNAGRVDSGSGIKYMNMFDAQVDAIHSALNAWGFKEVQIVVAETGWPYKGDPNEVGPSVDNAKAYNGNLINHLRSMVGTPLMPGISVDTYIFALYDEDLKPGPGSERSFGLFKPDLSVTYDVGLSKNAQTPTAPVTPVSPAPATTPTTPTTPVTPVTPTPKPTGAAWCMPKPGTPDAELQANLDYACSQAGILGTATSLKPLPSPQQILVTVAVLILVAAYDAENLL